MSKLIFEPAVFPMTITTPHWGGIKRWCAYNGYVAEEQKILFKLLEAMNYGHISFADGLTELFARICYRAFKSGRPNGKEYITNILESAHGSVLAHLGLTLSIQGVSRTLTHELIRHHVGVNPSQESQRYVDAKDMNFVVPPLLHWAWNTSAGTQADYDAYEAEFILSNQADVEKYNAEQRYLRESLAKSNPFDDDEKLNKRVNEAARCHLPGCAETRLDFTLNLRAARDILGNPAKRGGEGADLEIRRLALHMLREFKLFAPIIFDDLEEVQMPVVNGIKSIYGGV